MAYMNLLIRERGDLRDTLEDYRREIASADQWVQKALETKRLKTGASGVSNAAIRMAPPPGPNANRAPQPIRIGANVQSANLIHRVDPVYPPARIQGVVKFTVTIDKEGKVSNLQLVSGHPVLIPPAIEAVRQWLYKPTLLNGQPVEVITTVDVNFSLAAR